MKRFFIAGFLLGVAAMALAQKMPTAGEVIGAAQAEAAKTNRHVFVRFTASWCGWCHRMDGVLKSASVKPVWDKYFVSVPIVVLETPEKAKLEHPGGRELLKQNGGENQGIPYFYFTDAKGKVLGNSKRPATGTDKGGNVGCPYEPAEIEYFMELLRKAAPTMRTDERAIIRAAFEALKRADGKAGG